MRTKLLNAVEEKVDALVAVEQSRGVIQALRDFQEALALKESPYWIIMKHLNFIRLIGETSKQDFDLEEIQQHLESLDEDKLRNFAEKVYGFKYVVKEGEEELDEIDPKWKQVNAL